MDQIPEFVIPAYDGNVELRLFDLDTHYFGVEVTGVALHAKSRVYFCSEVHDLGDLIRFFEEIASEWRGWIGEKTWSSDEGDFSLSCSSDKLGHVTIGIELTHGYGPAWVVQATAQLDAGQLEGTAKKLRRFLSSGDNEKT